MKVFVEYILEGLTPEEADLDEIVEVPDDIEEDEIPNWISNKTGWLVLSWEKCE